MYPMQSNPLQVMINSKDCILANGASVTNLFIMGLSYGNAPELWNKPTPEKTKSRY